MNLIFSFFDELLTTTYFSLQPSLLTLSREAFLHVDARSGFNRLQAAVFQGDYDTFCTAIIYLGNFSKVMKVRKTGTQAKVFPGKTTLEILLALQDKGEGYVKIKKLYNEEDEKIKLLTELHLCRDHNDSEKAVELVLNQGVDVNILGKSNLTPLMWARLSASHEFIETLIDLGADVNVLRTGDKVVPLRLAAYFNNHKGDILLNHRAKKERLVTRRKKHLSL